MQTGISTASLFFRKTTEDALRFLSENKVCVAEVFLESYCEYNLEFGQVLKSVNSNTAIHSVHTLTTQFEPQLYSINARAQADSFKLLERTMECAKTVGAKYYTFHGGARFKKTPMKLDFEWIGKVTQRIIDECAKQGVTLAYENVHWGYYNYVGFFEELKKRTHGLKGTLDIKQARQSGIDTKEFIKEMAGDVVTVHLSDIDRQGKMCLPGRGITDFNELFSRLNDVGFDGSLIIESYQSDYEELGELIDSLAYVTDLAKKVFGKRVNT